MTSALLPVDSHAHVEPSIDERELRVLRAFVIAVTRRPAEWNLALGRHDQSTIWGIGVHPGVKEALEEFDPSTLPTALERASVLGEVGLDGRASTDKTRQGEVFATVLDALRTRPRPVTIHSVGACAEVLEALKEQKLAGTILHWWRGDERQTKEAIDLGCFFSLNAHEIRSPKVLDLVPADRVLTETDFPHTRRYDKAADRPGRVGKTEEELGKCWDLDIDGVRKRIWTNLGSLFASTDSLDVLPRSALAALAMAGFEG